jgi:hypothetical protein
MFWRGKVIHKRREMKAPSTKFHHPEKLQIPSSKWALADIGFIGELPETKAFLMFGAWNFPGAWRLEFGASLRVLSQTVCILQGLW